MLCGRFALSCGLLAGVASGEQVLHDSADSGIEGLTDSGFLLLVNPPFGSQVAQAIDAAGHELSTAAAKADSAGLFSHSPFDGQAGLPNPPTFDRHRGFTLSILLQLVGEDHHPSDRNEDGTDDRAGLSVLVVTSDLRAIELGFWEDRIWAQADGGVDSQRLFTQAEGVEQDPEEMARMRRYELTVFGDRYFLLADGTLLLSGPLRDYTAWPGLQVPFVGTLDPYDKPNLLFVGDNTSSASARFRIGSPLTVAHGALRSFDIGVTRPAGLDQLVLRWGTLPGLCYVVEESAHLREWSRFGTLRSFARKEEFPVPLGEGPRTFYRIVVEAAK